MRLAASVCTAIVVGWYWIPFLAALLLLVMTTGSGGLLLFFYYFFYGLIYLTAALTLAIVPTLSLAKTLGSMWPLSAFCIGFLGTIILGVTLSPRPKGPPYVAPLDPLVLGPDLLAIDKCSQQFAESHPDAGYPASLDQLGPQGTRCLTPDELKPADKGFTVGYEPAPRDGNGRLVGYKVIGKETSPKSADTSRLFSDESGMIWYRFDGPHGLGSTSLYHSPEYVLHKTLGCLGDSALHPSVLFVDGQSQTVVTDKDEMVRRCLGTEAVTGQRVHQFSLGAYDFEYDFTLQDGKVNGYRLIARPRSYGIDALRSYLAVETMSGTHGTLKVFVTPQNRPATPEDPLALAQEIGMTGTGGLASIEN
ncbi:MAG: hypothetical protein WBF04_06190 [Candidatus Sulfotelmatobacter sp.]